MSHDVHPPEGVEPEGIHTGAILQVTFVTALFVVILVVIGFEVAQHGFREAERMAAEMTGYPQLQSTTEAGLALINEYGVVNADEGRYRIPVDRAMDLVVSEAAGRTGSPELRLSR